MKWRINCHVAGEIFRCIESNFVEQVSAASGSPAALQVRISQFASLHHRARLELNFQGYLTFWGVLLGNPVLGPILIVVDSRGASSAESDRPIDQTMGYPHPTIDRTHHGPAMARSTIDARGICTTTREDRVSPHSIQISVLDSRIPHTLHHNWQGDSGDRTPSCQWHL